VNNGLLPPLLERIKQVFHTVEVRQGMQPAKNPSQIPYTKELTGHPRYCGSVMGAEILWGMDILEKTGEKPCDADYTAVYRVAGTSVRILGRPHRYLDYPVNVFLNVCMLYDGRLEIVDFCVDLLAQIAPVNWFACDLPGEMDGARLGGKDAYRFDRAGQTIVLDVPTDVYKRLPLSLTSSIGSVGRVALELVPGETYFTC